MGGVLGGRGHAPRPGEETHHGPPPCHAPCFPGEKPHHCPPLVPQATEPPLVPHVPQATEPIVDLALRHGKPFAVVPCCVFPNLFPTRRTRGGGEVRDHAEFCEYLLQKDAAELLGSELGGGPAGAAAQRLGGEARLPPIGEAQLGLEGRSTIIWWAGASGGEA